ncbi:39S ribosomal protein L42, mitochondrial [Notolabrus celidotus]|uniref:39S ribosomal protein L42, mitochondrial n=1 Tax=Notolabrus celidotus TaxID=1203425 RepID=UPI00149048CF|nr:39S ribosomal protein L42, mitochondrial [Notolabrus celidotus]
MASGHLCRLHSLLTRLSNGNTLLRAQTCLVPVRHKSGISGPSLDGPNSNVEIGVTSDGKTVVCYHPTVDIPYEFTQPIERPDPLTNPAETHDQVLKAHLSKEVLKDKKGPTIEELSKMFHTTKHRWYPFGQYRTRRIKKDPPKDR